MRRALIIVLAAVAACAPRYTLRAPGAEASLDERSGAHERLAPAGGERGIVESAPRYSDLYLVLPDGRLVHDPLDLIPVVGEDTPTARMARRSARSRAAMRWSLATFGLGLVGGVSLAAVGNARDNDVLERAAAGPLLTAVVAGAVAYLFFLRAKREKLEAFRHYGNDLRTTLRLCVDGLELVDCTPPP